MANIQAVNGAGLGPVVTSVNGEVGDVDVSGASIPDASETVKGLVELATDAETATGTDTERATTPANVAFAYLKLAGGTLTGALVGTTITAATSLRAGAASWAQSGAIRLASLGSINWRNAAGTGDIGGFSSNASDQVQVASDFVPSADGTKALGSSSVRWASLRSVFAALGTSPAATGSLRLGSTGEINWRNAANNADIGGFSSNAGDQIAVGTALVPATDNTKELGTGALRWASIAAAGEVLGKDFAAVGLTGAVTATRYVGGTADVAPVTGTFLTGDYVISATARVWICTTGGSPGTWAEAGSGTYQTIALAATKAGTSDLIDTAGDSLTGTADNTLGKLAKGTAFQVRRMNSAANAEEWATPNLALARPKTGSTVYPGWPNAAAGIVASSTAIAAATDRFIPFEVRRPITITDVSCSTTTTAVGKFAWVGIVALNTDMQPSSAVTQQSSVTLDATGTHTWNPTTLTLDAGLYAVCWNHDSTATFRFWYFAVPGMAFNDGAYTGTGVVSLEKARAAAAFSGTPSWDTPVTVTMSTGAFSIYTPWMMKWTPA